MMRIAFAMLLAVLSAAALADATKEPSDTKAAAICHSTEAESHAGCCCCPGDEKAKANARSGEKARAEKHQEQHAGSCCPRHTSQNVQAEADCAEKKS